jgi:hypothetical protein
MFGTDEAMTTAAPRINIADAEINIRLTRVNRFFADTTHCPPMTSQCSQCSNIHLSHPMERRKIVEKVN